MDKIKIDVVEKDIIKLYDDLLEIIKFTNKDSVDEIQKSKETVISIFENIKKNKNT